jgi:hypothetical protein
MPAKGYIKINRADIDNGAFHDWSKAELLVYLTLKRYENKDHVSFPGYRLITKSTGLSSRSIAQAILLLVKRKVITRYRTEGRLNYYLITMGTLLQSPL